MSCVDGGECFFFISHLRGRGAVFIFSVCITYIILSRLRCMYNIRGDNVLNVRHLFHDKSENSVSALLCKQN